MCVLAAANPETLGTWIKDIIHKGKARAKVVFPVPNQYPGITYISNVVDQRGRDGSEFVHYAARAVQNARRERRQA
jgi:hypothetical protein